MDIKKLLVFTNKGNIYKVPVFLMKNLINKDMSIEDFVGKKI